MKNNNKNDNNKDDTDDKSISAVGLDRDLRFLQGNQGHWPHVDGDEEDDNDRVEANNKEGNNNMDDTDDKSISALTQDRDLGFSLCLCSEARKFGKKAVKSMIVELQKFFYTVLG